MIPDSNSLRKEQTLELAKREGASFKDGSFGAIALQESANAHLRGAIQASLSEDPAVKASAMKRLSKYLELVSPAQFNRERLPRFSIFKNVLFGDEDVDQTSAKWLKEVNTEGWSDFRKEIFIVKLGLSKETGEPTVGIGRASRLAKDIDRARKHRLRTLNDGASVK